MKNKKELGQNWLKNREVLEDIAELAFRGKLVGEEGGSAVAETCVEIGPGLGTLTSSLLRRFEKVVAVEFDENLAHNLPKSFPGKNLEVRNVDILKYDFLGVDKPFVVAGNIPYYITSPIIEKLIHLAPAPERIVLLIQKEVAERIAAGTDEQTVLSLMVQNRAEVELGPVVKRDLFTPAPKVDSQIIMLTPKPATVDDDVFDVIRVAFSSPRKKLVANLAAGFSLPKTEILAEMARLGIDQNARPANLSLLEWKSLANFCHKR